MARRGKRVNSNISVTRGEESNSDSLSSGERNGKSLNRAGVQAWWRCRCGVVGFDRKGTRPSTELQSRRLAEAVWKAAPKWVTAPYAKGEGLRSNTRVAPDPGKPA